MGSALCVGCSDGARTRRKFGFYLSFKLCSRSSTPKHNLLEHAIDPTFLHTDAYFRRYEMVQSAGHLVLRIQRIQRLPRWRKAIANNAISIR